MIKQNVKKINIAIFGSTGHISKNLIFYLSQKKEYNLFLLSRDKKKLEKILKQEIKNENFEICDYNILQKKSFNVIINSIGTSDPGKLNNEIIKITEFYDNKIIDYLEKNNLTIYINFSSGAIYGHSFDKPVTDDTYSILKSNDGDPGYLYSIAKLYSEGKHRTLKHLNIVDLRIFSFFSRFIDPNSRFFLSEVISAIKNKTDLSVDKHDIVRDFVHPKDLCLLIEKCIKKTFINDVFDVYSKKPISKFEILNEISKIYGLKYHMIENTSFRYPTGIKEKYYSLSRKARSIGYEPEYSSLDTIMIEIKSVFS